jgi:hypothetical protein
MAASKPASKARPTRYLINVNTNIIHIQEPDPADRLGLNQPKCQQRLIPEYDMRNSLPTSKALRKCKLCWQELRHASIVKSKSSAKQYDPSITEHALGRTKSSTHARA